MTHAWCRDVQRDEAVRAAEDGRTGPLPTLEQCIERVMERRPVPPGGGGNVKSFAEDAKCSPALSETGEGQSGLRTERVAPPAPESRPAETRLSQRTKAKKIGVWQWFPPSDKPAPPPPPAPPRVNRGSGVFDANGDEVPWEGVVAALKEERDAAIRERDAHKARAVDEMPAFAPAPAIAGGTVLVNGQDMVTLGEFLRHTTRLTQEASAARRERDAAIRERDAAKDDCERLRWRVAELEAAPAASPVCWIALHEQSPPVGEYVMCRWDVCARQGYAREVSYGVARRQFDGMWRATNGVEKIAPMHWMPLPPGVEGGDSWEAAPAASGAASSSAGPKSSTNGWLTEEERKALTLAADQAPESDFVTNAEGEWIKETLTALLARSSPPEVELPVCEFTSLGNYEMGFLEAIGRVKRALAAAGVAVKEVGK